MSKLQNYKEMLKNENLRSTRHRNSILEVMEQGGQPVSAETLFLKLKDEGVSISLSTVYRVIEVLVAKGLVVKASVTSENKALFEINCVDHKHHVLCVKCHKMLSVDGCPLEEYQKSLEEKIGFSITGHRLEIFGYCQHCKEK